ncbi:MAG TPA: glycoside hydrolase family 16 protein [Prolixibacteraceae bacterium]|nr:glycoside hydrolase family 16 protein [Prolixibacteraceae bacterium]
MRIAIKLLTIPFVMLCLICQGCNKDSPDKTDTIQNGRRIIEFSGYKWVVESSSDKKQGPGPNYFSDSEENVWLDQDGKLHLRITYKKGIWYCAKVTMLKSYSSGRYVFQVDSRVDNFDKNVVGGLFTYKNDTEEIDIEFSKWNSDGNMDSQFAVQPSSKSANKKRFFLNLTGEKSTHWFNWQRDRIDFMSYQGQSQELPAANNIIQQWTYTGNDIPPDSDEKIKINLWLFKGAPPSDLQETEMVISKFSIH